MHACANAYAYVHTCIHKTTTEFTKLADSQNWQMGLLNSN
jgi:hypothetical protein